MLPPKGEEQEDLPAQPRAGGNRAGWKGLTGLRLKQTVAGVQPTGGLFQNLDTLRLVPWL